MRYTVTLIGPEFIVLWNGEQDDDGNPTELLTVFTDTHRYAVGSTVILSTVPSVPTPPPHCTRHNAFHAPGLYCA